MVDRIPSSLIVGWTRKVSARMRLDEEGRYGRSSRNVGWMRWTRRCRVRMRSQGEVTLVSDQEARETSGIVAYGEVVWFWHPLLTLRTDVKITAAILGSILLV
jgi:hypothetical protein